MSVPKSGAHLSIDQLQRLLRESERHCAGEERISLIAHLENRNYRAQLRLQIAWLEGYMAGYVNGSNDACSYERGNGGSEESHRKDLEQEWNASETKTHVDSLGGYPKP